MIVCPRAGQLFAIKNNKKVMFHYLVTSDYYQHDQICPTLHHRVICFETGEDMSLSEDYLNMAERSGWRQT